LFKKDDAFRDITADSRTQHHRALVTAWAACWSKAVTLGVLIFSSLVATGAALAGDISKNVANSKLMASVKGDKVPPKGAAAAVVVHNVRPEAPKELEETLARLGRSGEQRVILQHGSSKFCFVPMDPITGHHVKDKSHDSNQNLTSADIGAIINRRTAPEFRV
jgi:hypothetical protein